MSTMDCLVTQWRLRSFFCMYLRQGHLGALLDLLGTWDFVYCHGSVVDL